jgi:hypothetical protein
MLPESGLQRMSASGPKRDLEGQWLISRDCCSATVCGRTRTVAKSVFAGCQPLLKQVGSASFASASALSKCATGARSSPAVALVSPLSSSSTALNSAITRRDIPSLRLRSMNPSICSYDPPHRGVSDCMYRIRTSSDGGNYCTDLSRIARASAAEPLVVGRRPRAPLVPPRRCGRLPPRSRAQGTHAGETPAECRGHARVRSLRRTPSRSVWWSETNFRGRHLFEFGDLRCSTHQAAASRQATQPCR